MYKKDVSQDHKTL